MHFKASKLYLLMASTLFSVSSFGDDYFFDPTLFQGSVFGQDLERFNNIEQPLLEGEFLLDISVNDQLVGLKHSVLLQKNEQGVIEPNLQLNTIELTKIRFDVKTLTDSQHYPLSVINGNVYWEVDQAQQRLNLHVSQKDLYALPRGTIPVSEWDKGTTTLFVRHNTNYYNTENQNTNSHYNYVWSNIYSGTNLGLWQFRHQGHFRYSEGTNLGRKSEYNSVRTWLQRPIPEIESILVLGESYTNSSLLGGISFKGVKIGTDKRMWPQSRRGFAPEVRGVAPTTSRVVIRQQGNVVYETSVPPGPFVINDLYNTRMQGDLEVEVIEANGQRSTFTVPFSSTPESIRAGAWSYDFAIGKVRQYDDVDNQFMEGTLQYGLNNHITSNFGVRLGQNYQAGLLGGVYASPLGAFGLNTTWSRAKVENEQIKTGWRIDGSYSNTINATNTNIVLGAYRYSTEGFRDLQDVLGIARQEKSGISYASDTLKQKNRFSLTINQPLEKYGSLYLAASTADYYGDRSRMTQLQFGYSNNWNDISYNINMTRQKMLENNTGTGQSNHKKTENSLSLSVSIPFDFGKHRSSLSFDTTRTSDAKNGSVSLAGSAGEQRNFSYSIYAGLDKTESSSTSSRWGATVQQNTSIGAFKGSISNGENFRQYGLGASGTLMLHSGGLTLGPYVSDTFALVHAPGANGAIVKNGQGAVIDRFGYAIMPSLTPYRYNNITLDTSNMVGDVELQGGGKRVVPYFGAVAKVSFDTKSGTAVLIDAFLKNNEVIPMGADVMNNNSQSIGMVGQGGQIYARLTDKSGTLKIIWGEDITQQCRINYQLPQTNDVVTMLTLPCIQE